MDVPKKDDLVGRHLIVDASTYSRRNLTSTDTVFALFEALNQSLDMTAILPPIVCRYPFANDEIAAFCDAIETELQVKAREIASAAGAPIDLSLAPVRVMREFLRRRQMEESGVTGVSIWAESHAAIHTWDEDNYYAFDAFSCKDFRLRDALRLLLAHFDIETLNCVSLLRYQRSIPRMCNFQVNARWEVIAAGRIVGDLDDVDFDAMCGATPSTVDGASALPAAASNEPDGQRPRRPSPRRRPSPAGTTRRRRPR